MRSSAATRSTSSPAFSLRRSSPRQSYRLINYNVDAILVDGDRAATMSTAQMEQIATDRILHSRVASFHRFKDGQIIEYCGFTNSFDSVEQTLGRELLP